MDSRRQILLVLALVLLPLLTTPLFAQLILPMPDATVDQLVALLESDVSVFEKAKACQQLAIVGDQRAVEPLSKLLADTQLSTYARSALEAIPGEKVDHTLRQAATTLTGDRLVGVLHSIGKRGDVQATETLAKLLDSRDQATASAAARALGYLGTPEAAGLLKAALSKTSGDSQVAMSQACLICIQRLFAQGNKGEAVALCDAVEDADVPAHIELAAASAAILAGGETGLARLAVLLDSQDDARFALVIQLARQVVFPEDLEPPGRK